jgi:hypothetical protein
VGRTGASVGQSSEQSNVQPIDVSHHWKVCRLPDGGYVVIAPHQPLRGEIRLVVSNEADAQLQRERLERGASYDPSTTSEREYHKRASDRGPVFPCEHPRTEANTYRSEGYERCRICHLAVMRAADRERRVTHFRCGHPRTPENSVGKGSGTTSCRECDKTGARTRYWDRPEFSRLAARTYAQRKNAKRYKKQYLREHAVAISMYYQLRLLMIADGCWPAKERTQKPGNGEAA